jgi:hypothetical protein
MKVSFNKRVKSFPEILAPIIVLGNVFSIFPVTGVFGKNIDKLKFTIWHPITIYSIVVNFCLLSEFGLLFLYIHRVGFQFFMIGK